MRRLRSLAAGALAALACLGAALPAGAAPPLWRIKRDGAEIVLFGSVHLLNPGQDWRTPAMLDDLAKAGSVWFEIPFDAASRTASAAQAVAVSRLPSGQTLPPRLSPSGRARLQRVVEKLGLAPGSLDAYRPWFAEVTLTVLHLQQRGAAQSARVEETLSSLAPASARREAFETPAQQVAWLSSAPAAEQTASLEETLRQIEDEPGAFDVLQKAWIDGDVAGIVREGVEPLRKVTPRLYRRLVVDRNRRWAAQIERLLKSRERAFIVVGVGHLVGPDSVPAMLRRRGVAVEGP